MTGYDKTIEYQWNIAHINKRRAWIRKAGGGFGDVESQCRLTWYNIDPIVKSMLEPVISR